MKSIELCWPQGPPKLPFNFIHLFSRGAGEEKIGFHWKACRAAGLLGAPFISLLSLRSIQIQELKFFSFELPLKKTTNQFTSFLLLWFHSIGWFVCLRAAAITAQLFQPRSCWLSSSKPNQPSFLQSKRAAPPQGLHFLQSTSTFLSATAKKSGWWREARRAAAKAVNSLSFNWIAH